ncbi:hypothetical protein XU18_3606 [Perkinsela sp. CCAP 1560/4]|nr:hypothetical protein XU18_3606 [Perkinsela sp. CCAP 1560/4]|eukprot:KNH05366.1 hypothetical protein XU18_3606 [Perkinsela sp. CCAP 1560/4]
MLSKLQAVVYFTCADDGIGKFDRSMLSQQDSMDFFIFGLNEPEKICDSRDDPGDVCEWTGVICNGDGEVEEFQWICKNEDGTGTLGFEFLPCSMKSLRMFMNALSSTIQLAGLPEKMEVISLASNKLTGSLDLDSLPHAFRKLYLSNNKFTVRRSEDPGTGPWHVSGGGVSPEHIHHHRDKTRALVASMICIGTCSENSRSPRIKFVRHMFNTNSPEKSPSKTFPNASKV